MIFIGLQIVFQLALVWGIRNKEMLFTLSVEDALLMNDYRWNVELPKLHFPKFGQLARSPASSVFSKLRSSFHVLETMRDWSSSHRRSGFVGLVCLFCAFLCWYRDGTGYVTPKSLPLFATSFPHLSLIRSSVPPSSCALPMGRLLQVYFVVPAISNWGNSQPTLIDPGVGIPCPVSTARLYGTRVQGNALYLRLDAGVGIKLISPYGAVSNCCTEGQLQL